MQPLAVHEGDLVGEGPAEQVVRECEPHGVTLDRRGDDPGAFGLIERVDQFDLRKLPQRLEQLEAELATEQSNGGEEPTRALVKRRQAGLDRQPDTLGNIDVARLEGLPTGPRNQETFVCELEHDLAEEERVSLRRLIEHLDDVGRRSASRDPPEQCLDVRRCEVVEHDRSHELASLQSRKRVAQDRGNSFVARIGRGEEDRQIGKTHREGLQEQERVLVGPVDVVDHDDDRPHVRQGREHFDDGTKQVAAFLARRDVGR